MASLLRGIIFEISAQAPAPSKDYHHLLVTDSKVIWRWWKISLRSEFRNMKPWEQNSSYQDFLDDLNLQVHISVIFGNEILKYICNLCQHRFDYLERLPKGLLMYIISFLELEDIARLSQTSRQFEKLEQWPRNSRLRLIDVVPELRESRGHAGKFKKGRWHTYTES
uniref:F-box only protein 36a isoform X3 n=1 Tax=Pristiophorus japonicus TaxID=55135 RepID=UPI00398EC004